MPVLVHNISTSLTEPIEAAIKKAKRLLNISNASVLSAGIAKTSLDARRRGDIHFVHTVSLTVSAKEEDSIAARFRPPQVTLQTDRPLEVVCGSTPLLYRPVIVGFGPAGMFAGLLLARYGYRPIIFERGAAMEKRVQAVETFWKTGVLDCRTNIQFGEGGAGTFSDGKLTTRIGDNKCAWVLQELVRFGAPSEILYRAKPHIGTDLLRTVVCRIRQEILRLGGELFFETALTGLQLKNGQLHAVETERGTVPAQALLLAPGHSARDTFEMLLRCGAVLQPKPFSVGVRIEHLQSEIDRGCYGDLAGHPALPPGEYQLSYRAGGRGVYTFCMCPGGFVVPAASEEGMVVTNGMSCYARDGKNANAAVAVSVSPAEYGTGPLDGVRFQQTLERDAFVAGGGAYRAPAQTVDLFLQGKGGMHLERVEPTYHRGVAESDLSAVLPGFVTDMLRDGLRRFAGKLPGFTAADAVLTGVETRTSSPVRLLRKENYQAEGIAGLYPCAEGAGYAGGIMSAAVDGLRCALALMQAYAPNAAE